MHETKVMYMDQGRQGLGQEDTAGHNKGQGRTQVNYNKK